MTENEETPSMDEEPLSSEEKLLIKQFRLIGNRLIKEGIIGEFERTTLVDKQGDIEKSDGEWVRLGELAVREGYCTAEEVESMRGYLGSQMIETGLITKAQRDDVLKEQRQLKRQNIKENNRFGEICVTKGFCTEEEVKELLDYLNKQFKLQQGW